MSKRSMLRVLLLCTLIAMLGSLALAPIAQGEGPLYTTVERFGVGVSPNVSNSISDYDLRLQCWLVLGLAFRGGSRSARWNRVCSTHQRQ